MRGRRRLAAGISVLTLATTLMATLCSAAALPLDTYPATPNPAWIRSLTTDHSINLPAPRADDGANTPEYILCVQSRYSDVCGPDGVDDGITGRVNPESHWDPFLLPWSLRFTRWDCLSDARYTCTHTLTNDAHQRVATIRSNALLQAQALFSNRTSRDARVVAEANQRAKAALAALPPVRKQMVKYYDQWVFVRAGGVEQPLSAIGMGLTFVMHLVALIRLRARANHTSPPALPDAFPLAHWYSLSAFGWAIAALSWCLQSVRNTPPMILASAVATHAALGLTLFQAWARLGRWAPQGKEYHSLRHATTVMRNAMYFWVGVRTVFSILALEGLLTACGWIGIRYFTRTNNIVLAPLTWISWMILTLKPHFLSGSTPLSISATTLHDYVAETEEEGGSTAGLMTNRRTVLSRLRIVLLLIFLGVWLDRTVDVPPLYRTLDVHATVALILPIVTLMWHTALAADGCSVVSSRYWTDPSRIDRRGGNGAVHHHHHHHHPRSLSTVVQLVDRGCVRATTKMTNCVISLTNQLRLYAVQRRERDPEDPLAQLLWPESAEAAAVALADTIGLTKALPELKALGRPEYLLEDDK